MDELSVFQGKEEFMIKSIVKSEKIFSSSLTLQNIKALFNILKNKCDEAMDIQIAAFPKLLNENEEEYNAYITKLKENFKITIGIYGENGEQILTEDVSELSKDDLPNNINTIIIDSFFKFRNAFNFDPLNKFNVNIDMRSNYKLNLQNKNNALNESFFNVSGNKDTWVNGVYKELFDFFKDKKTNRRFLYDNNSLMIINILFVIPIICWILYKFDLFFIKIFPAKSNFFYFPIYAYVVFILIVIYGMLINFQRKLYPYIEFEFENKKWSRVVLGTIFLGILTTFIYDIAKALFSLL